MFSSCFPLAEGVPSSLGAGSVGAAAHPQPPEKDDGIHLMVFGWIGSISPVGRWVTRLRHRFTFIVAIFRVLLNLL